MAPGSSNGSDGSSSSSGSSALSVTGARVVAFSYGVSKEVPDSVSDKWCAKPKP